MKILHISPEHNWSKIFLYPIIFRQLDYNEVWLSVPNGNNVLINDFNIVNWNRKYVNFISYFLSAFVICYNVRKFKISKVFLHTSLDSFIYIIFLRLFTPAQIIYINHGVPYYGYRGLIGFLLKIIESVNLIMSHVIITITKSMTDLLNNVNFFKKPIHHLTPGTMVGVDIKVLNYDSLIRTKQMLREKNSENFNQNLLNIIYVGRIEYRKGIYELIEAVNSTNVNCQLIVLGGTEHDFKKKFNREKIKFLGYQSDLSAYYLVSDLLCVPSHHEGFGQVYLEAASFGVIPICSNIPGPTDFVKNELNGFVVEPNCVQSIIDLLNKISEGKINLENVRRAAFNSALEYNKPDVIRSNMRYFR